MADWQAIKTEYITTDTSYRKLAEKYGIHYNAIANRAKQEGWVSQRNQFCDKTVTKTLNKISEQQAGKMARIDSLADKLLLKLERAIDELDLQLCKHTDKTKIIEYNNLDRPDKPTKEIIHEEEKLLEVQSIVDRKGLREITSALKDLKEVKMIRSELDEQEQLARIENLRKQANREDSKTGTVTVVLEGGLEDYAQ